MHVVYIPCHQKGKTICSICHVAADLIKSVNHCAPCGQILQWQENPRQCFSLDGFPEWSWVWWSWLSVIYTLCASGGGLVPGRQKDPQQQPVPRSSILQTLQIQPPTPPPVTHMCFPAVVYHYLLISGQFHPLLLHWLMGGLTDSAIHLCVGPPNISLHQCPIPYSLKTSCTWFQATVGSTYVLTFPPLDTISSYYLTSRCVSISASRHACK